MVKHQSQRNIARALVQLWSQVVDAYPEDAYAAAAMLVYRNVHDEPWGNQEKLTLWFQALGGDTYFTDGHGNGRINWTAVVEYLITDVACDTCPIGQLPRQTLRSDLSQGQGGPLGMPCRVGQEANRCIHGLAPNDSFDVRVPWDWGQHPGVVSEGGDYRAKSYDDLLAAWQAQAAQELADDEATAEAVEPTADGPSADGPPTEAPTPTTKGQAQSETGGTVAPVAASAPEKPSPVVKQRAQIADFMKRHELSSFQPANPWRITHSPHLAAAAGTNWTAARQKMNLCLIAPGPDGCATFPSACWRPMRSRQERMAVCWCPFAGSLPPISRGMT